MSSGALKISSGALKISAPKERQQGAPKSKGAKNAPRKLISPTSESSSQNELHSAFVSLKGEIGQLSSKLESVSKERDLFQDSLTCAQATQAKAEEDNTARIENVTQQYEERLTELHSVIAELTRKIERHDEDFILEEDEEDLVEESAKDKKSKSSYCEYSAQNQNDLTECSTSETCESDRDLNSRGHTDVSTSCEIDDRAVQAGQCIDDIYTGISHGACSNSNATDDAVGAESSSICPEEELKLVREEKNSLTQALSVAQQNISSQRSMLLAMGRERDALKYKLREYQKFQAALPQTSHHISDAVTVKGLRNSPVSGALNSFSHTENHSQSFSPVPHLNEDVQVICKLAEKVRLKKAKSGDLRVTGSELCNVGIYTTGVAEQLVAGLQEESDAQELYHALATAGGAFAPHERLKEYELEAERLHSRIDHLRAQNDVLEATLSESKAHCDHLALLMGKAESQAGALKMGVTVLDQIHEAYEVLSALHEAQICLLATTCRVAGVNFRIESGFNMSDEPKELHFIEELKRVQEQRRTAENVARHLLSRLDKDYTKNYGNERIADNTERSPCLDEEESKIRRCIQRLQEDRVKILSCLQVPNDTSPEEEYFCPKFSLPDEESHKLDLENAVLMQELTAIREDRAELRAQVYLLEREKVGLELGIGTCEAQTVVHSLTIDHLRSQLSQVNEKIEETGGDSGDEASNSEPIRRERELKNRVEELVLTLEKVTKNSEARHLQSQEFINDLKKANSALLTAVDRLKKKYTLKIKRLEQHAVNLMDKYSQQVRDLKLKVEEAQEHPKLMQQSSTSDISY